MCGGHGLRRVWWRRSVAPLWRPAWLQRGGEGGAVAARVWRQRGRWRELGRRRQRQSATTSVQNRTQREAVSLCALSFDATIVQHSLVLFTSETSIRCEISGTSSAVMRVVPCSWTLKLLVPCQFSPRRDEFRTMRALSSGLSSATLIAGKP